MLYCHGCPSSRLGARLAESVARGLDLRVIATDRPSYGNSDLQEGRRLADWPRDAASVADALGLDRFLVLGLSGGGPCAMGRAAQLSRRLTRVAAVCGLGPPHESRQTRQMGGLARLAGGISLR